MDTKKSTYRRLTINQIPWETGWDTGGFHNYEASCQGPCEELKTTSCMKPTKVDIMSTKHEEIHEGLKLNGSGLSRANLSGVLYIEHALALTRHKVNWIFTKICVNNMHQPLYFVVGLWFDDLNVHKLHNSFVTSFYMFYIRVICMCQRAQDGHGTPCASLLCGIPRGALHVAIGQPDLGSGCLDKTRPSGRWCNDWRAGLDAVSMGKLLKIMRPITVYQYKF